jgi:hypothetical protein
MDAQELPLLTLQDLVETPESTRSPGLHLSAIISDLMMDLDPKKYGGEMDWNRVESGVTFERLLEKALMARNPSLIRPGEYERDGIACSPDGYSRADHTIEEYKFTWKSSKYPITDDRFWSWLVQIKGYCYVIGTTHARLRVLFVNGNYSSFTPVLKSWALEFTPEELSDNWAMLLNHAKHKGLLPDPDKEGMA